MLSAKQTKAARDSSSLSADHGGLIVKDEWLDLTDWTKLLEAFIEKHEQKNKRCHTEDQIVLQNGTGGDV